MDDVVLKDEEVVVTNDEEFVIEAMKKAHEWYLNPKTKHVLLEDEMPRDKNGFGWWIYTPMGVIKQRLEQLRAQGQEPERTPYPYYAYLYGDDIAGLARVMPGLRLEIVTGEEHWKKGRALRATSLLIDHYFNALGANKLNASFHIRNNAAKQFCLKLGFKEEGILRRGKNYNGPTDIRLMGLIPEEAILWRKEQNNPAERPVEEVDKQPSSPLPEQEETPPESSVE